jgi:hypothetical protein
MPSISANAVPSTNGAILHRWFGSRRAAELVERVSITADTAVMTLNKKVPARSKVIMQSLKLVTAVGLAHSAASGTSVLCNSFALCQALPTTNATSATTTMVMITSPTGATSTNTSGASRSIPAGTAETSVTFAYGGQVNSALEHNTATSDWTLYMIPIASGESEEFNIQSGTDTDGHHFGTTGTVDVQVWYEDFETYASA